MARTKRYQEPQFFYDKLAEKLSLVSEVALLEERMPYFVQLGVYDNSQQNTQLQYQRGGVLLPSS